MPNGYDVSFESDENVLELDVSDGYIASWVYQMLLNFTI
jgi:hypothetical protein